MSRTAFSLALSVLAAGCEGSAETAAPPAKRSYVFTVNQPSLRGNRDEPVKLFVDGRAIEPGNSAAGDIRITTDTPTPRFTASVRLPCGRKEIEVASRVLHPSNLLKDQHGKDVVYEGRIALEIVWPGLVLVVDNRGGQEASLSMGELTRTISADMPATVGLPAPDCEEGHLLKLDGRDVGAVGRFEEGARTQIYLVDPSAKRCYEYTRIRYSQVPVGGSAPEPLRLPPAHLHVIPDTPTDLFKEAPFSVQSRMYMESRTQLLEIKCP